MLEEQGGHIGRALNRLLPKAKGKEDGNGAPHLHGLDPNSPGGRPSLPHPASLDAALGSTERFSLTSTSIAECSGDASDEPATAKQVGASCGGR